MQNNMGCAKILNGSSVLESKAKDILPFFLKDGFNYFTCKPSFIFGVHKRLTLWTKNLFTFIKDKCA